MDVFGMSLHVVWYTTSEISVAQLLDVSRIKYNLHSERVKDMLMVGWLVANCNITLTLIIQKCVIMSPKIHSYVFGMNLLIESTTFLHALCT